MQCNNFRVSRSLILFFLAKSYFVLFFGKCPILSYFLAILVVSFTVIYIFLLEIPYSVLMGDLLTADSLSYCPWPGWVSFPLGFFTYRWEASWREIMTLLVLVPFESPTGTAKNSAPHPSSYLATSDNPS